jgi:hypothetical protein
MKWVCLMANMTVPGVGTLICKRWISGTIQTVGSVIGIALLIHLGIELYHAVQVYAAGLDEPETMGETFKGIKGKMTQPFIIGCVGGVIFKVMWIWAQVSTAQVFKADKAAETQEATAESGEVPPPLDSSN